MCFHHFHLDTYNFPCCHNGWIHQQGYPPPRLKVVQVEEKMLLPPPCLDTLIPTQVMEKMVRLIIFYWPFSFYCFVVSQRCPLTLSSVFPHFAIVWRGHMTQLTILQWFSVLGGTLSFLVLYGFWLVPPLFPHPVCSLKCGVISHFLHSWLLGYLLSCYNWHHNQSKHKNRTLSI